MEQGKRSGGLGALALIGCGVLILIARRLFPSLASVLLWIFGIAAAAVVLLVGLVLFSAFRKPKRTPEQEVEEGRQMVLKKARGALMELRTGTMRIRQQEIRKSGQRICATLDKILGTLKAQPEDLPRARRFLNHVLPMLSGILRKYAELERNGVVTQEVTAQTISTMNELEAAAQKQYESLFDNDVVDITADMIVLTQLCRQNGLLEEDKQPEQLRL